MFISSYTTIYFFVKKFIFSNVYISVNSIFECLYMFLVEKEAINYKCIRNCWGDEGQSKMLTAAYSGSGITPHGSYALISFHVFCSFFFFFVVSCFICKKINLTFIQKRCICQKRLFTPAISVIMK